MRYDDTGLRTAGKHRRPADGIAPGGDRSGSVSPWTGLRKCFRRYEQEQDV